MIVINQERTFQLAMNGDPTALKLDLKRRNIARNVKKCQVKFS